MAKRIIINNKLMLKEKERIINWASGMMFINFYLEYLNGEIFDSSIYNNGIIDIQTEFPFNNMDNLKSNLDELSEMIYNEFQDFKKVIDNIDRLSIIKNKTEDEVKELISYESKLSKFSHFSTNYPNWISKGYTLELREFKDKNKKLKKGDTNYGKQ